MVVAARKISLRPLDLDAPRAGIGKAAGAQRCGDGLFDRHHQHSFERPTHFLLPNCTHEAPVEATTFPPIFGTLKKTPPIPPSRAPPLSPKRRNRNSRARLAARRGRSRPATAIGNTTGGAPISETLIRPERSAQGPTPHPPPGTPPVPPPDPDEPAPIIEPPNP